MIHSAHCARNITICQTCKEPVPVAEMKRHTELVNCRQCGESMQACDVASHVTDACSQTPVQCQYCELLLCRQLMADHELYCGTRTERCPDCHEHVMIKYKRLHEDSNHGFIKLDDDPEPWENTTNKWNLLSNIKPTPFGSYHEKNIHQPSNTVKVQEKYLPTPKSVSNAFVKPSNSSNYNALPAKRTNDMPQINDYSTSSAFQKENQKENLTSMTVSKGAIKKHMAPLPPDISQPSTSYSESPREKLVNIERSVNQHSENIPSRSDKLSNKFTFTPMTPNELALRLKQNNVPADTDEHNNWNVPSTSNTATSAQPPPDRFTEIKNELRVLRKELKDCSSPFENKYKNNKRASNTQHVDDSSQMVVDAPSNNQRSSIDGISDQMENFSLNQEIKFPEVVFCSKCDNLIPFSDILSHESMCGVMQESEMASEPKKSHGKKKKSHKKSKAPSTPQDQSSSSTFDDMSGFMLPCEFCQNMIPANLLVEHEAICCSTNPSADSRQNAAPPNTPDGSSGSQHSTSRNMQTVEFGDFENMEEARGFSDVDQDEVMLPCEFCMMPICASELMRHQESCYVD